MNTLTEEQYLTAHGASRNFGDAGLHRSNSSVSARARKFQLTRQNVKDETLLARRQGLREEYYSLVREGTIRPLSRLERLKARAAGHPDNVSTQAARRIIANFKG